MPENALQKVLDNGTILNKTNVIRQNGQQFVIDHKGDWDDDATGYTSWREDEFTTFFFHAGEGLGGALNLRKGYCELRFENTITGDVCQVWVDVSGIKVTRNGSVVQIGVGASGSFMSQDGKTVTVENGQIVSITE